MKLLAAITLLAIGPAHGASHAWEPTLMVCLDGAGKAAVLDAGRAIATSVLRKAGISIVWRNAERPCLEGKGIVVSVSTATPKDRNPGVFAYAMPYERTHVVLLLDRLMEASRPAAAPRLLGYVLVHEIGHMLQGVARHSSTGILKAHWDSRDHADIQLGRLRFTPEDIELMFEGLSRMR